MKIKTQKKWTMIAILGMSYWFFGNLYEQIVIAPNWVVNSVEQVRRLNEFFINTSPTHYFVPITLLAPVLVWILYFSNKIDSVRKDLRIASVFAILDSVLTTFIVATIVMKLFGEDYLDQGDFLNTLTWRWTILNIFRMTFSAFIVYYLFSTFRKLDKMDV